MKHRPLVLLHGGGPGVDAASNWLTVRDQLARRAVLLAPDLLGFGSYIPSPDGPPLPRGPRAWAMARAEQVVGLLDQEGFDRVDLLGNSAAGGAAALALAESAPERVGRLVVMGGAGTGPVPQRVPFYDEPTHASMRRTLTHLLADADAHSELVEQLTEQRVHRASRPGAEAAFRSMLADDAAETIPLDPTRIHVPVLALHGELDAVSPVDVSRRLVRALPHGRLEVVEGAGHWIHVDRPARFCQLVEEFVAG